jgi:predicted methyltransferase
MSLRIALLFVAAAACGPAAKPRNPDAPKATDVDLGAPPDASDARLDWAIAGAQRSAANRARDPYRHPKETLAFFGVTKDKHVIELWPGGGWYTEVLAPFLRDSGKLGVTVMDPDFEKKLAAAPSVYAKVDRLHVSAQNDWALGPDESADVVLTFRNVHNWIQGGFAPKVFASAFKVLKHGGTLGVEEHRGDPGIDEKPIKETGYVPEQTVIDFAQAAGFKLDGKSDVNANAKDDHKHESGVWALPPVLANGAKDRGKYLAIGESDRMTLKFTKP